MIEQIAAMHNDGHPVADYLREIADNLDSIFVRRQNAEGRWGNASLVRALLAQKEALSAIVLHGVEQGWVTRDEHEAALRLREPQGQDDD